MDAASPHRTDPDRRQSVRLHQVQVWRQGKPQVRHHGVRKEAAVPKRHHLHVRAARSAHYWEHGSRVKIINWPVYNVLRILNGHSNG